MQYSIVNYKTVRENPDFRIDAEYFKSEYLEVEKKLKNTKNNEIKNGVDFRNYEEEGQIYYIRTADIKCDGFQETAVRINYPVIPENVRLKENDILFTRKGNYGKNCIVNDEIKDSLISSEIMLLRKRENNFSRYFISIFLNSKYGQNQIERNIHGVSNFSITQKALEALKVPILSQSFQLLIEELVIEAHRKQSGSKKLYREAEELLLSDLGLLDWEAKHELSFTRNFSDTHQAERFDAEYFQPKYDEIIKAIKNYKGGFDKLGNLVEVKDQNFTPQKETKYKYIELSNILSNGEINGYTENLGDELPSRARRQVQKNDLIVSSIEGSLESIAVVTENWENVLCSTGFFSIHSENINPESLFLLLKTKVGQLQLKRGCKGTILTAIGKEELSKIVLPKIDVRIQSDIRSKVTEMYESKKLSQSLLEIAKVGVEKAIEQDEQIAEEWMDNERRSLA